MSGIFGREAEIVVSGFWNKTIEQLSRSNSDAKKTKEARIGKEFPG